MNTKKKTWIMLLTVSALSVVLAACGNAGSGPEQNSEPAAPVENDASDNNFSDSFNPKSFESDLNEPITLGDDSSKDSQNAQADPVENPFTEGTSTSDSSTDSPSGNENQVFSSSKMNMSFLYNKTYQCVEGADGCGVLWIGEADNYPYIKVSLFEVTASSIMAVQQYTSFAMDPVSCDFGDNREIYACEGSFTNDSGQEVCIVAYSEQLTDHSRADYVVYYLPGGEHTDELNPAVVNCITSFHADSSYYN